MKASTNKPLTNLKTIRLNLGLNQTEFGDMLGFSRSKTGQSYYRKVEAGLVRLSAHQAYTIMRTFTISLKDLLEITD